MFPDGPALTIDGVALDVYDGSPMYFSHDKELSQGHVYKVEARRRALQLRAERWHRQVALAALLVDLQKVCSLDEAGVLYGCCTPAPRCGREADRARRFQRLCARRHRAESTLEAPAAVADSVCCWLLPAEEKALFIVDAEGIVQDTGMTCRVAATRGPLAQRLRRLYRKKQLRRSPAPDFPVACAHPNGFVSWVLPTPPTTPVHMASTASLHPPVCRIDLEGHVHDIAGLKPPQSPADVHCWERLKLFHKKRHSRWQVEATGHVNHLHEDWDDVYVNNSGTTTPVMDFGPAVPFERTCSMDSEGVLHCSESHRLERTCSIDSEGIIHNLEEIDASQPCLASRLKLYHRKKHQRDLKASECPFPEDEEHHSRLIVSLDGRVQGWQEYEEEPLIVPVM